MELSRLGVHLDPVLQGIDAFLEQHSHLVEQVRLDLERGLKNPGTGRNGITSPFLFRTGLRRSVTGAWPRVANINW